MTKQLADKNRSFVTHLLKLQTLPDLEVVKSKAIIQWRSVKCRLLIEKLHLINLEAFCTHAWFMFHSTVRLPTASQHSHPSAYSAVSWIYSVTQHVLGENNRNFNAWIFYNWAHVRRRNADKIIHQGSRRDKKFRSVLSGIRVYSWRVKKYYESRQRTQRIINFGRRIRCILANVAGKIVGRFN